MKLTKFSEILIKRRELMGYGKPEFAKKLGISLPSLYKYEGGKGFPPVEILIRMAEELETSTDFLVGKEPVTEYDFPIGMTQIPLFQVTQKSSDSPPTFEALEGDHPFVVVRRRILQGHRGPFRSVSVLEDSMKPILEAGDNVVVACGNKAIRPDAMYAVWASQTVKIKYLQRTRNRLYLIPNNKEVPIEDVDLKSEPDPILGEVVGVCKTFRKRK